ncbi:MAG TPA: hypothetical protein VGQ36_09365 [Thermoanaerobaculia bacterium]|jgi:hypothetical protein|nr:hypothetical protein [Thermoanaerobaculia bacterium]
MTVEGPQPQPLLRTLVFPSTQEPVYPELTIDRFSPTSHPIGVCFSGGGPRAMSCAMGQMRALMQTPLYDLIGAISCISGGSWFGSIFSFADKSISDADLLGPVTQPGDITLDSAAQMPRTRLGFGLTQIYNDRIQALLAEEVLSGVPDNRRYANMLNHFLLGTFGIDDVKKFFSLDDASVAQIVANNTPGLTAADFYTMRANRPYFIAGATQVYPVNEQLVMRQFEYSPLYDGTPQFFPTGASPNGAFGGGYVQNFAFDSSNPQTPDANGLITVDAPLHRFAISDLMGSSGAAPGSVLDAHGLPSLFAEFHYWDPRSAGTTPDPTVQKMSIVDGGDLENTGIVALLRRQYPLILVGVNTLAPMGADKGTYEGVDSQIAALFGFTPPHTQATREIRQPVRQDGAEKPASPLPSIPVGTQTPDVLKFEIPQQPIQVFPSEDWPAVRDGLKTALAGGGPVYFASEHRIYDQNPFGISPYPNDGTVKVVWLYNQRIANWVSQLRPEVAAFLDSKGKTEFMANFPNLRTMQQNSDLFGIKELLQYTPRQVNLLADMWTWAILEIAADLRKLVNP